MHETSLTTAVCETVLLKMGEVAMEVGSTTLGTVGETGSGCGAGAEAVVVLVGAGAITGDCAEGRAPVEIAPVSRLTRLGAAVLPEKNSDAVRAGSSDGARGKISDWKDSDYEIIISLLVCILMNSQTLRGTMKAIGSTVAPYILYARAISHSPTFKALRGRKHMPR